MMLLTRVQSCGSVSNILKNNSDKIIWNIYSANPNAIEILEKNQDKIDWSSLSININAIEILEKNQDNIYWNAFSKNPAIFTYDYEKIKDDFKDLGEEIIAKALHPDRLFNLMNVYDKNEVYNTYFN